MDACSVRNATSRPSAETDSPPKSTTSTSCRIETDAVRGADSAHGAWTTRLNDTANSTAPANRAALALYTTTTSIVCKAPSPSFSGDEIHSALCLMLRIRCFGTGICPSHFGWRDAPCRTQCQHASSAGSVAPVPVSGDDITSVSTPTDSRIDRSPNNWWNRRAADRVWLPHTGADCD